MRSLGGKKLDTILTPEGNGLTYDYTGALLATESWSGEVTGTVGCPLACIFTELLA